MSSPINKVIANLPQAFSSGEKAQARANIDAQASITYSYSGSTITAIDGSAVGRPDALTAVQHDSNLSGSGTQSSPLGLNSSIAFTTSNRQNTIQSDKVEFTAKVNPHVYSGTYRPWGWDISGSATSTTGIAYPQTAIVQNTSYYGMYNTSDDNEQAQSYLTFRGCGFDKSGTGGAGDELHTQISLQGITSISGHMGTASSHTGFYLGNGSDPDRPLELKFESGTSSAKVDIDSINRWNSLQPGIAEYVDPLGGGTLNSAYSASDVYTGYNWTKRTISASGLPAMDQYGFASVPVNSGTYGVNSSGSFNKITDLFQPFQTGDSNLYAQVVACSEAGRSPVLVGSSGQVLGNLAYAPNAEEAVFSRAMPSGGTHQIWHVKSDGTVSSSQIRGFDATNPYGAIHRTRIDTVFNQNSSNNYVWGIKSYCTGNWEWNDGSYSTYTLRELCTGGGLLDVFHYHWSFWVCHSTEDTVSTSTVAYFEVSPMIELWSTGGAYSTAWAPSNNYTIVPVHGYESSVNQGVTSWASKWEKLELDYIIPKVAIKKWIDNTAAYSDAIVSPRVKLMGLHTTGDYHYLGIRMGTESVSFLNHL